MYKKAVALILALILLGCCGVALSDGPLNRQILRNSAQTISFMPKAAKDRVDSIIIGVTDLFGETNPFWARTIGDQYLTSLLYDELIFVNNDGVPGSGVADYSVSAGGTTFTFTIKDHVVFADGVPVVSDDFINAFYLLLSPGFDGVYDITRAGIEGVDSFLSGEASDISGIKRISDKAFSITVKSPNPSCLVYFAIPALRVTLFGDLRPPESVFPPDRQLYTNDLLAKVREIDATQMTYGQYALSDLKIGDVGTLAANASYWRGAPYIGTVQLKVIPIGDELDAILRGDIDLVNLIGSVETVDKAFDYETAFINLYTWEGDVIGYLGLNLDNPIFSDIAVRKALAIGFDREKARVDTVERYGSVPGMLLFDSFDANSNMLGELYRYNPDLATSLLSEAGWEIGSDGVREKDEKKLSFTLCYNTPNPVMDRIIPNLVMDYEQLGIDLKVEAVPFEELLSMQDENTCDMYFQARRLPASPVLAADLFVGPSHLNKEGYQSDRLQRILEWTNVETDPVRQSMMYENLFQELYVELPFIPLYRRSEMLLANARIMNLTVTSAHDITADMYRFFLVDTLEGQW